MPEIILEIPERRKPRKLCGLALINATPRQCAEEKCSFWITSTKMCVVKDIGHSLKHIAEGDRI